VRRSLVEPLCRASASMRPLTQAPAFEQAEKTHCIVRRDPEQLGRFVVAGDPGRDPRPHLEARTRTRIWGSRLGNRDRRAPQTE
jgi:hypothetical protein